MGGAINPQDPNSPLYGTDAGSGRYPNIGPTDAPIGPRRFRPNMFNPRPSDVYNLVGPQTYPRPGQMPMDNPQAFSNMMNMLSGLPQPQPGQMTPPQDYITMNDRFMNPPQPFTPQPFTPQGPRPGAIIDPVRPGYGQQPTRGPAPRDMMPGTLQQGLGGLGGFNKLGGLK